MSSPPSNLTVVSVSGDGSCENQSGLALNCSLPFVLTAHVVFVALPLQPYEVYLQTRTYATSYYTPLIDNATTTSIQFTIASPQLMFVTGINEITIVDQSDRTRVIQYPFVPAFSLFITELPAVTSVTGCARHPAPLLASGCDVDRDTLTLVGVGFSRMASFSIVTELILPDRAPITRVSCCFTTGSSGFTVYNNTLMTIFLSTGFNDLLVAEHFVGNVFSWSFQWNGYSSNKFNITMAKLPAPLITSYQVLGVPAVVVNNVTTYPGCLPGIDRLLINGKWLLNGTLAIGSSFCNWNKYGSGGSQLLCELPVIEPVVNNSLYNIVFNNPLGDLVINNVIGFTTNPVISSIVPCWSDSGYYTLNGYPAARCAAGESLVISGRGFLASGLSLLNITIASSSNFVLRCLNSTVMDDTTLSCILPVVAANSPFVAQLVRVSSSWTNEYNSNTLARIVYDYLNAPRITSISGCGGQTSNVAHGLILPNCVQGSFLNLSGENFFGTEDWLIGAGYVNNFWATVWFCSYVTFLSNSSISCQLPTASELADVDLSSMFGVVLAPFLNGYRTSLSTNSFYIHFVVPVAGSSSSSAGALSFSSAKHFTSSVTSLGPLYGSSSSADNGADTFVMNRSDSNREHVSVIVAVIVIVFVVAVSFAAVWFWKRWKRNNTRATFLSSTHITDSSSYVSDDWPRGRSHSITNHQELELH